MIDLCEEWKTGSKLCQNRFSQNFWIFLHKESHIQANFKLFRENLPSKFHLNERGQEISIFHLAGSFRVCSNLVCDLMKFFTQGWHFLMHAVDAPRVQLSTDLMLPIGNVCILHEWEAKCKFWNSPRAQRNSSPGPHPYYLPIGQRRLTVCTPHLRNQPERKFWYFVSYVSSSLLDKLNQGHALYISISEHIWNWYALLFDVDLLNFYFDNKMVLLPKWGCCYNIYVCKFGQN